MRARSFFFIQFSTFLFFFSFTVASVAFKPLNDEQADKVYSYLAAQWKPVDYRKPLGFETIFQELDPTLWPALPESYEWRVLEDKQVHLFKHKSAPDHNFDFVTYATDSLSRFNFLSRWDGITYHSFAYTRQNSPLSSYDDARKVFPISEFQYKGQTYMRGHCIDFLDTYGLSENSKIGAGTIIESISTLDSRNYIPEPRHPSPYWGETLRKNLVGQIRDEGGCYAQYMYYGLTPLRADDETAMAIPQGVYFAKVIAGQSPVTTSYHVSWSYDFTDNASHKSWLRHLQELQAPKNFSPTPFIHNLQKKKREIHIEEFPLTYQLPDGELPFEEYHKIVKAADHEVQSVTGKIVLIQYLLDQKYDFIQIQNWLKRLIKHAVAIHERGGYGFMSRTAMAQLLEKLANNKEVDKYGNFSNWLSQLHNNDQDEAKKRDKSTFLHLKPLKISEPLPVAPITEIDVGAYNSKKLNKLPREVLKQLGKESRIRLLNLTTQRANKIVEVISAKFSSPAERKKIYIEYTPNLNSTQIKGIRLAFTNIGITPVKIEPQQPSTSKPTTKKGPSFTSPQIPPPSSEKNFKHLLTEVKLVPTDLDLNSVQKLQCVTRNQAIAEYVSCPTVGDGDCFFHAAFTESNESIDAIQKKAAIMRRQMCDAVQQGQYVDNLRPLIYEYYMELLSNNENHPKVPENVIQCVRKKNAYTSMYANMQFFGIPINTETTPNPENKFPIDEIKALILPEQIKVYIERLGSVGGNKTYIPFRSDMLCPVDILAGIGKKQINIFTFNTTEKKLQFQKNAGTEGPIVNILHAGNHFVRLYFLDEGENSLHQCEQIWENYLATQKLIVED